MLSETRPDLRTTPGLDEEPSKKLFFDDVRTPKPGKSSPSVLVLYALSQSIGRGRISD